MLFNCFPQDAGVFITLESPTLLHGVSRVFLIPPLVLTSSPAFDAFAGVEIIYFGGFSPSNITTLRLGIFLILTFRLDTLHLPHIGTTTIIYSQVSTVGGKSLLYSRKGLLVLIKNNTLFKNITFIISYITDTFLITSHLFHS